MPPRLDQSSACILDAIFTAITIIVIRLTVGQRDQYPRSGIHFLQQIRSGVEWRIPSVVVLRQDATDACLHFVIIFRRNV